MDHLDNRIQPYALQAGEVRGIRDELLSTEDTVCLQRARLVTEAYRRYEGEAVPLKRARAFAHVLRHMDLDLDSNPIFAGNTSSRPRAWMLVPEHGFRQAPQVLLENEGLEGLLDGQIPPTCSTTGPIGAPAARRASAIWPWTSTASCTRAWRRCLAELDAYGADGTTTTDASRREYRRAMAIALRAVIDWSQRYAEAAERAARTAVDPTLRFLHRRVAAACRQVPARPARDLFEGCRPSSWCTWRWRSRGTACRSRSGCPTACWPPLSAPTVGRRCRAGHRPDRRVYAQGGGQLCVWARVQDAGDHRRRGGPSRAGLLQRADALLSGRVRPGAHRGPAPLFAVASRARQQGQAARVRDARGRGEHAAADQRRTDGAGVCGGRDATGGRLGVLCDRLQRAGRPGAVCRVGDLYQRADPAPGAAQPDAAAASRPGRDRGHVAALGARSRRRCADTPLRRASALRRNRQRRIARVPTPFTSALMRGCIARGQDMQEGMDYHLPGLYERGLTNAANALAAIEQVVFEEGALSMHALVEAMASDFEDPVGAEPPAGGPQVGQRSIHRSTAGRKSWWRCASGCSTRWTPPLGTRRTWCATWCAACTTLTGSASPPRPTVAGPGPRWRTASARRPGRRAAARRPR